MIIPQPPRMMSIRETVETIKAVRSPVNEKGNCDGSGQKQMRDLGGIRSQIRKPMCIRTFEWFAQ